jgi:hypothetical protein
MVAHYTADERVKVPEPMIRIIASAFSGAAGKGEAEEEIARVMAKPYTEGELRTQLIRQKKTTGGLTGLNYEIIKMMPGQSFTDLYKIMNRLWEVKHVPEFWTLKGLVGLPKKDEVRSVNDLRPIGLIEQTQAASHNLARVGTIIRSKRVSAYAKVSTINLSVTQGLLYKGVNSVWPTSTIATLERHVTRMIRQAMKLPRNYPAALIHGVTGGLGIKSFSQLHREGTERIITRCMDEPEPGKSTARGIANRAFHTKEKEDLVLGQG